MNFGPGDVKLTIVRTKKNVSFRKKEYGVLPDLLKPYFNFLKLERGDVTEFVFLFSKDTIKYFKSICRIGVSDTFNRDHWATASDMADFIRR